MSVMWYVGLLVCFHSCAHAETCAPTATSGSCGISDNVVHDDDFTAFSEGAAGDALLQVRGDRLGVQLADAALDLVDAYSDNDFIDLGKGSCRLINKTTGKYVGGQAGRPESMRLSLSSESACKAFCKGKETPDGSGRKCWGYTFLRLAPKCVLFMDGPLTLMPAPSYGYTYQHCYLATKFHSTLGSGSCTWIEKRGYYVREGHGLTNECYRTLEEAKKKCEAAKDCRAIASQSNVCDGKYRVTHGGPTLVLHSTCYGCEHIPLFAWYCKWEIDTRTEAHKAEAERQIAIDNLRAQLQLGSLKWGKKSLTVKASGCKCYFDEKRHDCACCSASACQCGRKHFRKCAPCAAMWRCELEDDISDESTHQLFSRVSRQLLTMLLTVLEAKTYEVKQAGIRDYLREAYHQRTSHEKMQAVALLDAKLNEQRMGGAEPMFEFPDESEIEEWLSQMFLEEDLFRGDHGTSFLGLESRPELLQIAKSCDWHNALSAYYDTQGFYGNWCGVNALHNGTAVSSGVCDEKPQDSRPSKFQVQVCNDSGFDEACSRHDQGNYGESVFGVATKSLCKVDADFSNARKALRVHANSKDAMGRDELSAVAGANCLFDMMPCLRYEAKTYWTWCTSWSGGYPCKRTDVGYFTHYPFGKYDFEDDACGPSGCYKLQPQ